jgi:hypothetical protein
LPGQPPGKLPQVEGYHPKAFTAGGLLCHAQRYHGSGGYYDSSLALIPIIEGKARPDTAELLLPWTVGEFTPDGFRRWGTFRRGDYLIYALPGPETVAKSGKRRPGKLMLTVWDLKKKAKAWDVEGIPLAADDRYVYAYSQADGALVRRPLAGRGAGTRLSVPGLENILEVRPPKLLGLFGNDRVLSAFDLETGDRSDFDIRVSRASTYPVGGADAQDRPLYLRKDGPHAPFLSVARDDDTGVLYASRGTAIYEVPVVARHPATEKPKWEPLP